MMSKRNAIGLLATTSLLAGALSPTAQAAIALDRTRVIFDGGVQSVSLSVSNQNKQLPYLAQGWLEDAQGNKIQSPLTVLPPVQRIEPGKPSQVKIQALPAIAARRCALRCGCAIACAARRRAGMNAPVR